MSVMISIFILGVRIYMRMKPRCDFFRLSSYYFHFGRLKKGAADFLTAYQLFLVCMFSGIKISLSANLKHFQYQQEIFIRLRPTATNTASDRAGLLHREHSEQFLK